jgi:hypothetical protein
MKPVSRQRIGKHVTAATDTHDSRATVGKGFLSTRSVQNGDKKDSWGDPVICHLVGSSAREAEKIEPKRGKLKNLHC